MAVKTETKIQDIMHPEYQIRVADWELWRAVYESGNRFIRQYLKKFSARESNKDFATRLELTYCPAFAKSAVNEIKNSIYQRTVDVVRQGGPQSYTDACAGKNSGVDLRGNTMNSFIGTRVLQELLSMAAVGIYVDMPAFDGPYTLDEAKLKRPYLYTYPVEDVRSYVRDEGVNANEFKTLLLMDHDYDCDEMTGLPMGEDKQFRLLTLKPVIDGEGNVARKVHLQFFDLDGEKIGEEKVLNINKIPFVMPEITDSLLQDAAMYQVALLNLGSADLQYCLQANFPFYIEQFDPRADSPYLKDGSRQSHKETDQWTFQSQTETSQEIRLGPASGRKYPMNTDAPAFIHPSPEPLMASLKKQDTLKEEIRQLVGLSLSNVRPRTASAESKQVDSQGLEAGLSYIGLVLEYAENKIAEYWAMYLKVAKAEVQYPEKYSLESGTDTRENIALLQKLLESCGSDKLRKRLHKQIAAYSIGCYVKQAELDEIYKQIDAAGVLPVSPDYINQAVELGYLSLEDAAKAYGYPDDTVANAADEHADRLDRIAKAQTPPGELAGGSGHSRGVRDLGQDPKSGSKEKAASRDKTKSGDLSDKTRGPGK